MKLLIKLILISSLLLFSGCFTETALMINDNPLTDTGAIFTNDFLLDVGLGEVEGYSIIQKFGASNLDTTIHPITIAEVYQTPTTAQSLEFVSSSALDNPAGIGARSITIIGLNSSWEEINQTITTNGLTPVQIPIPLLRVYRWYVNSSGTYATATTGSHQGTLTIRGTGAGILWSNIPITPFPTGQSQIAVYTIPKGKTGHLLSKSIFVATNKIADIYMFSRCNADDVTNDYTGTMRMIERELGAVGGSNIIFKTTKGKFIGPCDVGFMGVVDVGTAEASIDFELLLVDD